MPFALAAATTRRCSAVCACTASSSRRRWRALARRAVALCFGGGGRRPHLLDPGTQLVDLVGALPDRGLRLVAQPGDLGVALRQRRLELLAPLALLFQRLAVRAGAAPPRRR